MVDHTRHLKLPNSRRFRVSRRAMIISGAGILVVLIAGITGWQLWQNNQYHARIGTYTTDIEQLLEGSKGNVEKLMQAGDAAKVADALQDLAVSLDKNAVQSPVEPRMFGLQLGTNADAARTSSLTVSAQRYAKDLRQAAAFIAYQNSVKGILAPLATKSSTDADQLNQLVGAWTSAAAAVKTITPPEAAKNVHAALVVEITDVVAALTKMPDLYKAVDSAGFESAKKDVAAAINVLNTIAPQFTEIGAGYDTTLFNDRAMFEGLF